MSAEAGHHYGARVHWARGDGDFLGAAYDRGHVWIFDGGIEIRASASPLNVPFPWSHADAVDPEEAFVAAIASCHMLTFLAIAAKKRFLVDAYEDDATGEMTPNADGKLWVSRVVLDPRIAWDGPRRPDAATIADMHHLAHRECFIANSVRTRIVVAGLDDHT
ncbi:OsmC family protein [Salinarimonas ramus]|uniref:Peroxiredoxin n=1 Tax=Salinarimonas ramus TaxID=690164 RepID=A0A917V935_9HYPH|nr:OsmC family protein [Salinarimonas ramus]GGK51926.1 peroxiredoxin [Salinarimonas ramus]